VAKAENELQPRLVTAVRGAHVLAALFLTIDAEARFSMLAIRPGNTVNDEFLSTVAGAGVAAGCLASMAIVAPCITK